MRIPSGTTDQYIYFVAVDATDLKTRETGLSSFTVYRSRNGAAAAAMTTPTINETDSSNMPGVYELLLDEDMVIASDNDSEEIVFHITHSGMAPVTRTVELYIPSAQHALRAQCGHAKRVWVASSTGSDSNDGLTIATPKTLKGCIASATAGDAIFHLPETSVQRLDHYWDGAANQSSPGFGNINLSAGVSLYAVPGTVTFSSFRALSADNNSQTSRGAIIVCGTGTTVEGVTIWPRASEPAAVVTYTRSGTTCTVAHTDHGFATGMTITLANTAPENINGDYVITVTGANAYTLTTAGSSSTSGAGFARFADYDIYQGSFGNINANDATFSTDVTLRRCKSRGTYASDVVYFDVTSSTLRQQITIEGCDFVAGWDCLFLSNSAQTCIVRDSRLETYGRAPVDTTYSRVGRLGNALVVLENSHVIYGGGSTTKRGLDIGGGTLILQRGTTITRSGDTDGSDVYASSASTIIVAGAGVDVSRISNSGGTNIHGQLLPTVVGRTLDVTSTGAAGVDWGNVENKTTTNALTNTTIDVESSSGSLTASDVWSYSTRSLTSGIVQVASPYQTGQQTVYRGMSYVNANGNAKTFTKGDAYNWPSDLASLPWTVTLYIEPSAALLTTNSSAASLSKAGTVASATSVRFDLTSSNTDDLTVTTNKGKYLYTVVASTGSHKWVLESGVMEVVDDLATA